MKSSGHVGMGELFSAFEDRDLARLDQLTRAIRTFSGGSGLGRTDTDSTPHIRPLAHSLSIEHFDRTTLRHVHSLDKSEPLYVYSLSQRNQEEDGEGGNNDNDDGCCVHGDDGGGGGGDGGGGGGDDGGGGGEGGCQGEELQNVLDNTEERNEDSGSLSSNSKLDSVSCDTNVFSITEHQNASTRINIPERSQDEVSKQSANNSEKCLDLELPVETLASLSTNCLSVPLDIQSTGANNE